MKSVTLYSSRKNERKNFDSLRQCVCNISWKRFLVSQTCVVNIGCVTNVCSFLFRANNGLLCCMWKHAVKWDSEVFPCLFMNGLASQVPGSPTLKKVSPSMITHLGVGVSWHVLEKGNSGKEETLKQPWATTVFTHRQTEVLRNGRRLETRKKNQAFEARDKTITWSCILLHKIVQIVFKQGIKHLGEMGYWILTIITFLKI